MSSVALIVRREVSESVWSATMRAMLDSTWMRS